jgi:thymidylate kinase
MRAPEIRILSLDGLNNNGKTTQVKYLKQELIARNVPAIIRKGDGSRRGSGQNELDPISTWWQENYDRINAADIEGEDAERVAREASRKLTDEVYVLKTREYRDALSRQGKSRGVIILDRGPVSRLFVARRYNPNVALNEALGFDEEAHLEEALPDDILVLHANKETLLDRNADRNEGVEKQEFNRRIIGQYYDEFERILETLPPQLAERTTIIDSGAPILEVGRIALGIVMERIHIDGR